MYLMYGDTCEGGAFWKALELAHSKLKHWKQITIPKETFNTLPHPKLSSTSKSNLRYDFFSWEGPPTSTKCWTLWGQYPLSKVE